MRGQNTRIRDEAHHGSYTGNFCTPHCILIEPNSALGVSNPHETITKADKT